MDKHDCEEIINLICLAKQELEKASNLLSSLKLNLPQGREKDALDIVYNYISHADDIVSWLKNSVSEE